MKDISDADIAQAVAAYKEHGSERKAAAALGISKTALHTRLQRAAEHAAETGTALPPPVRKQVGRPASSYRGFRRNAARAVHLLGDWRSSARFVVAANVKANLYARSVQANAAREAAAKAAVEHGNHPAFVHAAVVAFYRGEKRTRVVNRILRDLGGVSDARSAWGRGRASACGGSFMQGHCG